MTSISSYFYCVKRSEIKALCYALLVSMLVGCDAPGTARLKELCETEGFPKVYQQVSADGYYDDSRECVYAMRFLGSSDYTFVECKQTREILSTNLDVGLYRISKEMKNTDSCDARLLRVMENEPVRYRSYIDSGICFSLETINVTTAKYGLFNGESYEISLGNIFESTILARSKYIKAMESGAIVAEDKSFSLYPSPGLTLSSFERKLHCNTVIPENRIVPPLNQVDAYIKPEMTNRESSHGNNRGDLSGSVTR